MAEILGTFEQAVLLAIIHCGADAYGRSILHRVQSSLNRDVSAGSIYITLDRLENRGLISSKLAKGTPARGGRARRYYAVAAEGTRALNSAHRTISTMWRGIQWPVKVAR